MKIRKAILLFFWGVAIYAASEVELKWYPSECLMACKVTMTAPAASGEKALLVVTDEAGNQVVRARIPSKPKACVLKEGNPSQSIVYEAVSLGQGGGRLPEGRYTAELRWKAGQEWQVLRKDFLVKEFPWFHTDVGTRDVVMPGFTPVEAADNSVSVVGRRYLFGADGLPAEIWSLGEQLLAAPVRLIGGGSAPKGAVKVRKVSDTLAAFQGSLAAGRVEQDGLIVLQLRIPQGRGPVRLVIPIKQEYALFYHACGTGIRENPAGFLPQGTGKIFGSRQVPQPHYKNFVPYCWIGTDDRGICFAADNDRGWEHGEKTDALEIHRFADGHVEMVLNLVTGAGVHSARTIEVTLMASPVKPMPTGWRGWVDAYDVPAQRNTVCNCSNPTWGCYIVGMARYPTFEDWEFVRKMSSVVKTGKVDDAYVEEWIARCWKAYQEHPELVPWLAKKPEAEAQKTLRAHAFAAFRRALPLHGKKNPVFYYYTCDKDPCVGLYEMPVMQDEWGDNTSVYGSHADYAIYYLKKMCENGMSGVYNDNAFFRCNYDWVTGGAWIDNQGVVHPSFSFWALREYCRREILAMQEAGVGEPWLTIHNTNATILPLFSYATNTMGMEWKYGRTEFQDRVTPDYVRTVNQGTQGGFFPTALEGIFGTESPAEATHLTRTMLAALLPHEVQPTLQYTGDHKLVEKALTIKQQFGVGEEDCNYYAYYNPENPVVQAEKEVMISVYRRGGEMLLVIGSYADHDIELPIALKQGRLRYAENAENNAEIPVNNGTAIITLPRRDFAMVKLR